MILKALAVGDVVGTPGLDRIRRSLRYLKRKTEADLVIVNGENVSGTGITPQQAEDILDAGADLITLCSILRIPVCMHNVPTEKIFRPAAWNAFGMDKEGADYRACAAYGPQYKRTI